MSTNSFGARDTLNVSGRELEIFRLDALQARFDVARLPFSLKVLLENLLRTEGNGSVTAADVEALAGWDAKATPSDEIAFTPARVVMQDFTGVPAVVDLAAMRDAMADLGGDPAKIEPLVPAELVIDHSVQVDYFGQFDAAAKNAEREFERNEERYQFLRWGRTRSTPSRSSRRTRASSTRSTLSTSPGSSSSTTRRGAPTPTRSSGPTPTPRWSTAWPCWAGAWAASRRRPRCSASR